MLLFACEPSPQHPATLASPRASRFDELDDPQGILYVNGERSLIVFSSLTLVIACELPDLPVELQGEVAHGQPVATS